MSARSSAWVLAVAGLAGMCSMILELSAVRLIAPWFGTSSVVWTHVIGVVLLALSAGYLLGARLSRAAHPTRALGLCLLGAAAATGWLPGASGPIASWFRPTEVALDEAAELLRWGSLASAFVLFLPPTLLLGCIAPLATELVQRAEKRSAGDAGGRVLAVSTLGSIVGTFATTYVALPALGLSRTFLSASALLAVLGVVVLLRGAKALGLAALVLGGASVAALATSRVRAPTVSAGWELQDAAESPYQSVRVVEGVDAGRRMRRLQVNEGFDSFQSVWQAEPGFLPDGYYYNLFALPAIWSAKTGVWRLAVLGLGAGTTWRVLEGELPRGLRVDAIGAEIDPTVVAFGARWFDLPLRDTSHRVLGGWDARVALDACARDCDQIVLDAYANQMEIPAHLCTREFFRDVRSHLATGGWFAVNVGGFGFEDPVVRAVAATAADAFGRRVLALRVPFSRNCVLFVRKDADPPSPETEELGRTFSALALPGASRWFEPGSTPVLTDDHNPIDALQRQSVEEGRERWLGTR